MQSFSRIVSTIWWHGEIGLTPGLTNWGEARGEGQGLNGFCCRIIIKHPHFRNTSLARCRLLPWQHKRSDLDTCFSIFKAFKPFHKPREWVKLGCKNIWFQTNPFVSCQNFTILKQPIFPMFLSMAQQQTVTGEMLSGFLLRSPLRSLRSQLQLASLHQNCTQWECNLETWHYILSVFNLTLTCKSVSMYKYFGNAVSNKNPAT